jgi:hypothetical protein
VCATPVGSHANTVYAYDDKGVCGFDKCDDENYNLYEFNGKKVICPDEYNFGNVQRYGKKDSYDLYSATDVCWMTQDRNDCFDGTCDPTKYTVNGKTYPVKTVGDPRGKGIRSASYDGLLLPQNHADKNNTTYMVSAIPYNKNHCNYISNIG